MRVLHTSDWHIGRSFHGHQTLDQLGEVLAGLVDVVRARRVDLVVVAGDIFDSATPAAGSYGVLSRALSGLREAGAAVILTSGNHDSAARLGFLAEFTGAGGIHLLTDADRLDVPVTVHDEHGPVHVYGIPYLEPSLIRHRFPGVELRTQAEALRFAMDRVRADLTARGGRSIAMAHCFAVAVGPGTPDEVPALAEVTVERDITSGGLDLVPLSVFDGPDYVALGHLHGRQRLSDRVRYSGAPLHYSFGEADKPRGAWLLELDATGLASTEWVELPVPRPLVVLRGTIAELLGSGDHDVHRDHWVSAVLTDQARPLDGMRRLQERFPWCARLEHRPQTMAAASDSTYLERLRGRTDTDVVADFLGFVRNGIGPSKFERDVIAALVGRPPEERAGLEQPEGDFAGHGVIDRTSVRRRVTGGAA